MKYDKTDGFEIPSLEELVTAILSPVGMKSSVRMAVVPDANLSMQQWDRASEEIYSREDSCHDSEA